MGSVQTIYASSDREAAKPITDRDDERLGAEFSRYSPVLYGIALRKLGNVEDAEDAVQDALLSAFRNIHQFRGQAQFSTWLGSIVLNSARMRLRRRLNHALVSIDTEHEAGQPVWAERLEDSAPDAEETLYQKQARENLERVVEMLPVRLRTAFRLRVFEGLSIAEAATLLGVPEGTMKARVFRARALVTAQLCRALDAPQRRHAASSKH